MLYRGHRVERHPHRGHHNEGDGDDGDDLGSHAGVGLLYQVPQTYLILDKLSSTKVFLDLLPDVVSFLFHFLNNMFLPGVVLVLTTGLQVNLENSEIFS